MERERLTRLVAEPGLVGRDDLADLHALAERYPWFAGAQVLRSIGEHGAGEVWSEETLRTAAAHIPSRTKLFDLVLEPEPAQVAKLVVVPKEPAIPESPMAAPEIVVPEPIVEVENAAEVPVEPIPAPVPEPSASAAGQTSGSGSLTEEVEADPLDRQIRQAAFASAYDLSLLTELLSEEANEVSQSAPIAPTDTPLAAGTEARPTVPEAKEQGPVRKGDRLRFTDWLDASVPVAESNPPPVVEPNELRAAWTGAEDWLHKAPDGKKVTQPELAPTSADLRTEPLDTSDLIDRFIKQRSPPPLPKKEFYTPQQAAKRSLEDATGLVTETLARIYAKQGNSAKAIDAYHRLALKYPEKSAYFAALAKELEGQLNK